MKIEFSEEMEMIDNLTSIDLNVLHFSVETTDQANLDKRRFVWNVTAYNTTECTILFKWDSPPWISSTEVWDKIIMRVLDHEKFLKPRGRKLTKAQN